MIGEQDFTHWLEFMAETRVGCCFFYLHIHFLLYERNVIVLLSVQPSVHQPQMLNMFTYHRGILFDQRYMKFGMRIVKVPRLMLIFLEFC